MSRETAIEGEDISHAQFRVLADSIPTLAWMAHPDGWIFWYNQRWYEYTGTTPEQMAGWGWQSVHHPDSLPLILERWTLALEKGTPFEMTFPLRGADGAYRSFLTRIIPLREGNTILGWYGSNTDVTELEQARERLQLMVNELNHRVKNTLAVVQSIAVQTFKDADPAALQAFEGRLMSLAAVHTVLTQENWTLASVKDVILAITGANGSARFNLSGPEVKVPPHVAAGLAMTVHELCTNAAKYGALSQEGGRVRVDWKKESERNEEFLALTWIETGGPQVKPPTRRGFGTKLVERTLSANKNAATNLEFDPRGVRFSLRVPITLDVLQ